MAEGQFPFAPLVTGILRLCRVKQPGNIRLLQIVVFPQIP